jgi:PadR family transcriptional regulator, regulatory protein PadR
MDRERGKPRMTIPTQRVLRALLANPAHDMYGLQICAEAELPTGTIHPILARLENEYGWLTSHWEDIDPAKEGRPRRRYYRLTEDGAECARIALAQASASAASLRSLRARPVGGSA